MVIQGDDLHVLVMRVGVSIVGLLTKLELVARLVRQAVARDAQHILILVHGKGADIRSLNKHLVADLIIELKEAIPAVVLIRCPEVGVGFAKKIDRSIVERAMELVGYRFQIGIAQIEAERGEKRKAPGGVGAKRDRPRRS